MTGENIFNARRSGKTEAIKKAVAEAKAKGSNVIYASKEQQLRIESSDRDRPYVYLFIRGYSNAIADLQRAGETKGAAALLRGSRINNADMVRVNVAPHDREAIQKLATEQGIII